MTVSPISSITNNSREVVPGSLFLAYPGDASDGRNYILQAVEKGACEIYYDPSGDFCLPDVSVPAKPVENLRVKQSEIAAQFYGFPARAMRVIGVTGTNGKTSITQFIAQVISDCTVIGTMGYGFLSHLKKTANTTPDGLQLQKIFSEFKSQGVKTVAMEVSSHALSQERINDIPFETVVFTNLTQDHLDYHGTMENYRDAKEKIFQTPQLKNAVINIDDATGQYFSNKYRDELNIITYSLSNSSADIFVEEKTRCDYGFLLTIKTPWGRGSVTLSLLGEFNIDNALAVIGVLGLQKISFDEIIKTVSRLHPVSGRIELLKLKAMPYVVIDYAHTPDALEKILKNARLHCHAKLWCLFGCGGNRDKTKRPIMGEIAARLADRVIITNDNPRFESDDIIAREILNGAVGKNKCDIILNRKKAIESAVQIADEHDWIVIAGKGHETEQVIGDQALPHNDKQCAQIAFRLRANQLSQLAKIIDGKLMGDDGVYQHISIDSRAIENNNAFFAIHGEQFDGHDFVGMAAEKNAAVVIVNKKMNVPIAQIIVSDTRKALADIAAFYRETVSIPVIAITGSCGKTTTRALLENILKQRGRVLASQKSFNNDIGVPLTLLQLNDTHDFAVLEIGTNHPGEIQALTQIVQPTIATVTMAAAVHAEHFKNVKAIALEKGAIFSHLSARGIAVINADDMYASLWKNLSASHVVITFACDVKADVTASDIVLDSQGKPTFTLHYANEHETIHLPFLGAHNVMNALAAAAMASALQTPLSLVKHGFEKTMAVEGRLIEKKRFSK